MNGKCEICLYDPPCVLCAYVNKKKVAVKIKPLKFIKQYQEYDIGNAWMDAFDREARKTV